MIETVRLSQEARDQLITLKRYTGIKNWNVLCRWAFCASLREPSPPPSHPIETDSTVEMTWRVFGGVHADLYWALLVARAARDHREMDDEGLALTFRRHLHRGIGYLVGDIEMRSATGLVELPMRK
ncbi:DNA sulfur modification protein DndE [Gaopeijia maritima]|uniref:DNA sulfur modification protein DndE n=1 Tax=Gaopeijia maritima TaxID=3119007 RepID=UPI00327526B3